MSSRRKRSMQCPECGSYHTQAVAMAYSQSIRTGYNGNQSISEFGKELEPPSAESEFLVPLCGAAFLFEFTYFFMPSEIAWVELEWLGRLLTSFWGRVAISSVVSIVVLILLSGSAIGRNATVYADDMDEWERSVICRRCGEQFLR